jgi:DNA-binding beta-propeller fold protein YncE
LSCFVVVTFREIMLISSQFFFHFVWITVIFGWFATREGASLTNSITVNESTIITSLKIIEPQNFLLYVDSIKSGGIYHDFVDFAVDNSLNIYALIGYNNDILIKAKPGKVDSSDPWTNKDFDFFASYDSINHQFEQGKGIAVSNDSVFVVGESYVTYTTYQGFLLKYDKTSKALLFVRSLIDRPFDIVLDKVNGNIYILGYTSIMKYSSKTGTLLWQQKTLSVTACDKFYSDNFFTSMFVSSDGKYVYVSALGTPNFFILNGSSGNKLSSFSVASIGSHRCTQSVYVDEHTSTAYLTFTPDYSSANTPGETWKIASLDQSSASWQSSSLVGTNGKTIDREVIGIDCQGNPILSVEYLFFGKLYSFPRSLSESSCDVPNGIIDYRDYRYFAYTGVGEFPDFAVFLSEYSYQSIILGQSSQPEEEISFQNDSNVNRIYQQNNWLKVNRLHPSGNHFVSTQSTLYLSDQRFIDPPLPNQRIVIGSKMLFDSDSNMFVLSHVCVSFHAYLVDLFNCKVWNSFIAKFDNKGTRLFIKQFSFRIVDWSICDSSKSLGVIGDTTSMTVPSSWSFLHKYSSLTGELIWNISASTSIQDYDFSHLTVDSSSGDFYVTGLRKSRLIWDEFAGLFLLKFSSKNGSLLWERNSFHYSDHAVTLGGLVTTASSSFHNNQTNDDDIFLAGTFDEKAKTEKKNDLNKKKTHSNVVFLRKYSSQGQLLFNVRFSFNETVTATIETIPFGDNFITTSLFVDQEDDTIYVTGGSYDVNEFGYENCFLTMTFVLRFSFSNGSFLSLHWIEDTSSYVLRQMAVTSSSSEEQKKKNIYLAYGVEESPYYCLNSYSRKASYNNIVVSSVDGNILVIGNAPEFNAKSNQFEGNQAVIYQYSFKPKNSVSWLFADPIALYFVVAIIGIGIIIGILILFSSSFRHYVKPAFQKVVFCRLFYFSLGVLEVADAVSDVLWVLSTWALRDLYVYRTNQYFFRIFYASLAFLILSILLLIGKTKSQITSVFSSSTTDQLEQQSSAKDEISSEKKQVHSASKQHNKLHFFGLSVYYALTLSDGRILELHQQQEEERHGKNIVDEIFGLKRPNIFTKQVPLFVSKSLLWLKTGTSDTPEEQEEEQVTLWDVMFTPVKLLFTANYFTALFCFSLLLWPCSFPVCFALLFVFFIPFLLLNVIEHSNHLYAIRLLEDVPQFVLQVFYIRYVHSDSLNAFSAFSILCSGLLLTKFLVEVLYSLIVTSAVGVKVSSMKYNEEREAEDGKINHDQFASSYQPKRIQQRLRWYRVLYITLATPLLASIILSLWLSLHSVFTMLSFFLAVAKSIWNSLFSLLLGSRSESQRKVNPIAVDEKGVDNQPLPLHVLDDNL